MKIRRHIAPLLSAAVLTLDATTLPAQHAPRASLARPTTSLALAHARSSVVPPAAAAAASSSFGRPLAGALLGGAGGALVGAVAGLYVGGNRCSDEGNPDSCQGWPGLLIGSEVGFTLGAPVGAHLVNRRRGSLPASLLASAALVGAGVATLWAADRLESHQRNNAAQLAVVIAVPTLQVLSSAIIEHHTSRR